MKPVARQSEATCFNPLATCSCLVSSTLPEDVIHLWSLSDEKPAFYPKAVFWQANGGYEQKWQKRRRRSKASVPDACVCYAGAEAGRIGLLCRDRVGKIFARAVRVSVPDGTGGAFV